MMKCTKTKLYLKWLFSSVNQLVPPQLGTFNKGFATFRADVHAWTVGV